MTTYELPEPQFHYENPMEQFVYTSARKMGFITGKAIGELLLTQHELDLKTEEAVHDHLTGLLNRRGLEIAGEYWVAAQKPFVAIFYDLTNFKHTNDRFGHDEGDILLKSASDIIAYKKRSTDVIARLGGDEFVSLIDTTPSDKTEGTLTPLERAEVVMSRTGVLFHDHIKTIGMDDLGLDISMGAVAYDPHEHQSFGDVLRIAEAMMKLQKKDQHQEHGKYRP